MVYLRFARHSFGLLSSTIVMLLTTADMVCALESDVADSRIAIHVKSVRKSAKSANSRTNAILELEFTNTGYLNCWIVFTDRCTKPVEGGHFDRVPSKVEYTWRDIGGTEVLAGYDDLFLPPIKCEAHKESAIRLPIKAPKRKGKYQLSVAFDSSAIAKEKIEHNLFQVEPFIFASEKDADAAKDELKHYPQYFQSKTVADVSID